MGKIAGGQLQVGHIIEVKSNERIPADLLVLYADDDQGNVFIRTDQLDGETDWKLRKAVKVTQTMMKNGKSATELLQVEAFAKCQEPHVNIYQFSGIFVSK